MKKVAVIENKFRNNKSGLSFRNIRRKFNTENVSFTEKVNEKLKTEIKMQEGVAQNRTINNVILKVGDYFEYPHGNNNFKIIGQVLETNQKLNLWGEYCADIRGIIVDNLDSPYYIDGTNVNLKSSSLKYLKNYEAPEITEVIINKESLNNMKFINYNKFKVVDIIIDYSYITTIKDSTISCGVKQYSVINDLFNYNKFQNFFNKKHHKFIFEITKNDFYKIFCKKVMENIFKTYSKAGFLIISTNETGNNVFKHINKLLTSYDFISYKDTVNPNTNNSIRFWTCDLFSYRKSLSEEDKKTFYISPFENLIKSYESNDLVDIDYIKNEVVEKEELYSEEEY